MVFKKIKTVVSILSCFFLCTSFHLQDDTIDHFTPVKQFEWLKEFKEISECFSIDYLEKTKGKTFDSSGIFMSDGKYHPVNIFHYGISCFDVYRKTGNIEYKKKCLDQFKYFTDTSKYVLKEDGSIAFPYKVGWRDLKPPWFSGLAQAEGILYLIRYFYLTKDEKALEYIQRVKKFMLTTVDCGGTLNNLSDSTVWIEEYASSKSKAEVINGFVTVIISLREYCYLFPGDIDTKKILDKCLFSHKTLFYKYDLGNGIYYDLGEKQVVGAWYSKWQVIQMKQMFELFGDTFYKNIEMLWSTYAYNKPVPAMIGCLLTDTNFSSPAVLNKKGWIEAGYNSKQLLKSDSVLNLCVEKKMNSSGIRNLFDGNEQTSFAFKNNDSVVQPPYLEFELKSSVRTNALSIKPAKDSMDYSGYKFYGKEKETDVWKEIKIKSIDITDRKYIFTFKEINCSHFRIEFNLMPQKGNVVFSEINVLNTSDKYFTNLSHYITNDYALSDAEMKFKTEKKNVDDFVIFYKTGNTPQEVNGAKWSVYNGIRSTQFTIKSKSKYCRFLLIFKNNSIESAMSEIKPV
jgi:hypothetical protein